MRPTRLQLAIAFASVWVIWGSTYLAIRFAVETLPPFTMAAARFLIAGGILLAWAKARGEPWPPAIHWRSSAVVGAFLLLGGNGSVVWSEGHGVNSGMASLLVSTTPLWMVLIDTFRPRGVRPRWTEIIGVVLGFAGVLLLLRPDPGTARAALLPTLVCMAAPLFWSIGSIYARHAPLPGSPLVATALEMLCGGLVLALVGGVAGEFVRIDLAGASARSLLSFAYLTTFGSLVGFTAYIYLLKHTTPAKATTYAYVNPMVAVVLGWLLASEPLTAQTLVAMAVVVAGVMITITFRAKTPGEDIEVPIEAPGAEMEPPRVR